MSVTDGSTGCTTLKNQYGLIVLNYMVTSVHVHLSVYGHAGRDVIPKQGKPDMNIYKCIISEKREQVHSGRIVIMRLPWKPGIQGSGLAETMTKALCYSNFCLSRLRIYFRSLDIEL